MKTRGMRAAALGTKIGLPMAALSLMGLPEVMSNPALPAVMRSLAPLWGPVLAFSFYFVIIFPLAYAFPTNGEEPDASLRFEGARKVVWPAIALLAVLVIWLVLTRPDAV